MRIILFFIMVMAAACGGAKKPDKELLPQGKVRLKVDDAMINKGDLEGIILPMTWWIAIHGTDKDYEYEMRRFSRGQRMLYAVITYLDDTKKEGHYAYFSLAAPKAVEDALEGMRLMGLKEHLDILQRANGKRTGRKIEDIDFDEEDVALLHLNENVEARDLLLQYIASNRSEFYYNEIVNKP